MYAIIIINFLTDCPDAPRGLHQNMSFTTESSAVIRWESPLFTGGGGVVIMSYNITVNSQTVNLVSASTLFYNIPGLDYNKEYNVTVAAINSCGLESQPANTTVIIHKGWNNPNWVSDALYYS